MFITDPYTGEMIFQPIGMCFAEGDEDEGGGDTGDDTGDSGGEESPPNTYLDSLSTIEDEKVREYAGKFTSAAEVAKNAFEMRQKVSSMISLPGKDASEEDVAKYHKAIGVPESADKYEIDIPEGYEPTEQDTAFYGSVKEAAKAAGVSQAQLSALTATYNAHVAEMTGRIEEETTKAIEKAHADLEKEWPGEDFGKNSAIAQRALRTFADDKFKAWLEEGKIDGIPAGDHPFIVKMMANVGRRLGEDTLSDGGVSEEDAQDLKQEHKRLTGLMLSAQNKGDRIEAQRIQKLRDEVNKKLGTGAVVGAAGRSI